MAGAANNDVTVCVCGELVGARGESETVNLLVRLNEHEMSNLGALKERIRDYMRSERGNRSHDAATSCEVKRLRVFVEASCVWEDVVEASQVKPGCQLYTGAALSATSTFPPPTAAALDMADGGPVPPPQWWELAVRQEPSGIFFSTLASEYAGTLLHTFFTTAAIILDPEAAAGVSGALMICLTLSLSRISTTQFNPTTTVAMMAAKKTPTVLGLLILAMQLLGSVTGAALTLAMLPGGDGEYHVFHAACPHLADSEAADAVNDTDARLQPNGIPFLPFQAALTQLLSGLLVSTVMLNVVRKRRRHELKTHIVDVERPEIGLAIGAAYYTVTAAFGTGQFRTVGANPAWTLAMAIVSQDHVSAWEDLWIFLLMPLLGGLSVGLTYTKARDLESFDSFGKSGRAVDGRKGGATAGDTESHTGGVGAGAGAGVASVGAGGSAGVGSTAGKAVRIKALDSGKVSEVLLSIGPATQHADAIESLKNWACYDVAYVTDEAGMICTLALADVRDGASYFLHGG
eukprot:Rhum_TRINITY_DN512_c0_g1::Rhum_TRINITY_DN512_c0_g1_i1::g.1637::m.1637